MDSNQLVLILFFTLYSAFSFSQNIIEGTYYEDNNPSYVVEGGEYTYYIFYKNGTFKRNTSGELGEIDYAKGHYYIKKDSLIFDYDLTELKINDYHTYKYYANNKDSINVKITIRDINNKSLSDISILSLQNKIEGVSDENGIVEFTLKKRKKKIEFDIAHSFLGYNFNIWLDKSYDIDVFLRNDNYATPIKNQINGYKILGITKDGIRLRNEKYTTVLKKKN
jgi:hypothetical protein